MQLERLAEARAGQSRERVWVLICGKQEMLMGFEQK